MTTEMSLCSNYDYYEIMDKIQRSFIKIDQGLQFLCSPPTSSLAYSGSHHRAPEGYWFPHHNAFLQVFVKGISSRPWGGGREIGFQVAERSHIIESFKRSYFFELSDSFLYTQHAREFLSSQPHSL